MQVKSITDNNIVTCVDVRDSIESTLLQQERERLQQEWLDSLRAKAFIKMVLIKRSPLNKSFLE